MKFISLLHDSIVRYFFSVTVLGRIKHFKLLWHFDDVMFPNQIAPALLTPNTQKMTGQTCIIRFLTVKTRNKPQNAWKQGTLRLFKIFRIHVTSRVFRHRANISHDFNRNDLLGGTEAKSIMQSVGQRGSGIDGLVSFTFILHKVHLLQSRDDFANGILVAKPLFEVAVDNQSNEAGHEMSQYAVLAFDKGRSCLEIRFHNTKTFFNLPTLLIHPCNCFWVVFEIGADRIESVVAFFLDDNSFVDIFKC